jgi:hypothetical protein
MGDCCGPTLRHQLIENGGALIGDHKVGEGKKGTRKILTGMSVPLDTCLLMGDPALGRAVHDFNVWDSSGVISTFITEAEAREGFIQQA